MTEHQWLEGTDPDPLLDHLEQARRVPWTPAGRRKLRLFACACCRRIWHLLEEEDRQAVGLSERFADGRASRAELEEAHVPTNRWALERGVLFGRVLCAHEAARLTVLPTAVRLLARGAARMAALAVLVQLPAPMRGNWWGPGPDPRAALNAAERRAQADLLRHLFGNPFCPAALPFGCKARAATLARAIDEERRFEDMPVLADALEDAGCIDEAILSHCRDGGEHVRGCWLLDLLLDRS